MCVCARAHRLCSLRTRLSVLSLTRPLFLICHSVWLSSACALLWHVSQYGNYIWHISIYHIYGIYGMCHTNWPVSHEGFNHACRGDVGEARPSLHHTPIACLCTCRVLHMHTHTHTHTVTHTCTLTTSHHSCVQVRGQDAARMHSLPHPIPALPLLVIHNCPYRCTLHTHAQPHPSTSRGDEGETCTPPHNHTCTHTCTRACRHTHTEGVNRERERTSLLRVHTHTHSHTLSYLLVTYACTRTPPHTPAGAMWVRRGSPGIGGSCCLAVPPCCAVVGELHYAMVL